MSGCAVFAMGSVNVNNQDPAPPAWSYGSPIIEWTTLGGWKTALWFVNVTANSPGEGEEFAHSYVGLCPIDPVTGNWADVYSPAGSPVLTNDGGLLEISLVPYEYSLVVPLNGNAYELVLYGNVGSTMTLSSGLIVKD